MGKRNEGRERERMDGWTDGLQKIEKACKNLVLAISDASKIATTRRITFCLVGVCSRN